MAIQEVVRSGVTSATENVTSFVFAALGVGTLSMIVIQGLKNLTPMRRDFQEGWIKEKLGALTSRTQLDAELASHLQGRLSKRTLPDATEAERQLLKLAAAGESGPFYGLPIEQLCGQMNAAMQVAIDYPESAADLILCLASSAEKKDVRDLFIDGEFFRAHTERDVPSEDRKRLQAYVDARSRVSNLIQRAIDSIQIAVGLEWRRRLQAAAIVLSVVIALAAYLVGGSITFWGVVSVPIGVGLLAGFVAPVMRDIVAGLQSFRARR